VTRLNFPRKVRAAIIARAKGHCEGCGAVLKPGEGDCDHILPDALCGKPEASNGQWLCKLCHDAKTEKDIGRIRKADRARDKATGAMTAKHPMNHGRPKPEKAKATAAPTKLAGLPRRAMFRRMG